MASWLSAAFLATRRVERVSPTASEVLPGIRYTEATLVSAGATGAAAAGAFVSVPGTWAPRPLRKTTPPPRRATAITPPMISGILERRLAGVFGRRAADGIVLPRTFCV